MTVLVDKIRNHLCNHWFNNNIRPSVRRNRNSDPIYFTGLTKYIIDKFPEFKNYNDEEIFRLMRDSPLMKELGSNILLERYEMDQKSNIYNEYTSGTSQTNYLSIRKPYPNGRLLKKIFPNSNVIKFYEFPKNELTRKHLEGWNDLIRLEIEGTPIEHIESDVFEETPLLEHLRIYDTPLKTLNKSLLPLENLNTLTILNNRKLEVFPELRNSHQLCKIGINGCASQKDNFWFKEVDISVFSDMKQLRHLILNQNNTSQFKNLESLNGSELEFIDLSRNPAKILDHTYALMDLNSLNKLHITINSSSIPSEFLSTCSNIEFLTINGDGFETIENGFLADLTKLKELRINNTKLTEVPASLWENKNLRRIFIQNSELDYFDLDKINLDEVTHINLQGNKLENEVTRSLSEQVRKVNQDRNYRNRINFRF